MASFSKIADFVEAFKGNGDGFTIDDLEQATVVSEDKLDKVFNDLRSMKSNTLRELMEDRFEVKIKGWGQKDDKRSVIIEPLFD